MSCCFAWRISQLSSYICVCVRHLGRIVVMRVSLLMGARNDFCCFGIVSQSGGWFGDQMNNYATVHNRFY